MRSAFVTSPSSRSILFFPLPFITQMTPSQQHLDHASIRRELKNIGSSVATGAHAHARMVFKWVLQADAVSVGQIDLSRLAGDRGALAAYDCKVWQASLSARRWCGIVRACYSRDHRGGGLREV